MPSLKITIRPRQTKLSSSIDGRGVWINPCLNLRVLLRQSNEMADIQKTRPLSENEKPARRSNQEQGMYQVIKRRKGFKIQTIAVDVETNVEPCGDAPPEKGVILTGKKVYMPH